MRIKISALASAMIIGSGMLSASAESPSADLFQNPPHEARPHTWWHWLSGNVDNQAAAKDLQWMSDIGLGGLQQFNAHLGSPTIVDKPIGYLSDDWQASFKQAVATAKSLNLDYAIAASPGWSQTGGPWVKEPDGMKKLVWASTVLPAISQTSTPLNAPPTNSGPYQNIDFHDPLSGQSHSPYQFAKTITTLALPWPYSELQTPSATSSTGDTLDGKALTDKDYQSIAELSFNNNDAPTIVYTYDQPITVQASQLHIPNAVPPFGQPKYRPQLQAKVNGQWQSITDIVLTEAPTTVSFAPVTAKQFRLQFLPNPIAAESPSPAAPGAVVMNVFAKGAPASLAVAEWQLLNGARVHRSETKAGFSSTGDYYALAESGGDTVGIDSDKIIDVSKFVDSNNTLHWTAPDDQAWLIVQLGYSLTGKTNHPAAADATGLEVDKMDGSAVSTYLETYLGFHEKALGGEPLTKAGVTGILTDSIEVGAANWTEKMPEHFKRLRGYDLQPWLPALMGLVVNSRQQTEQFLYDYRKTLADLLTEQHYQTVAQVAHQHGLTVYGEALENGRPVLGDDIAMRSHADVPMAALWAYPHGSKPQPTAHADLTGAASVAHVYGRKIIAAESMTSMFSPWAMAPSDLKHIADQEFLHGINRPIIHTSIHHPREDLLPGLSLAVFGQYFNRHETWANKAKPWIDYISRSSYLLQQGHFVAEIAYFYGEEAPLTSLYQAGLGDSLPQGYRLDFVNAHGLEHAMTIEQGTLVNKSGNAYSALYLGGSSEHMSLATLELIAKLVKQGVTVIGQPPKASPSLADNARKFNKLVSKLWPGKKEKRYGKGRIINSSDLSGSLQTLGVTADFAIPETRNSSVTSSSVTSSPISYLHRKTPDADIYFLANPTQQAIAVSPIFRDGNNQPELWHAETGEIYALSGEQTNLGTQIALNFEPEEAYFVVFPKQPSTTVAPLTKPAQVVATINQPWQATLTDPFGDSKNIQLDQLQPLNQSNDAFVRYFSGTARYSTQFNLSSADLDKPLWLDLGQVGDLAEVWLNGENIGIDWMPPMRLRITEHVKPGNNELIIETTNLWVNRLIGDQQPGANKKTFTALPTYRADAPLKEAGLIGPVTLMH